MTPAANDGSGCFDLATTRTVTLSATVANAPVDTVFAARGDGVAGFRIELLNIDTVSRVRLVTVDKGGIQRASAWAGVPLGRVLTIATVTAVGESALLLEGTGVSLSMSLPQGVNGNVSVQQPPAVCE